MGSPDELVTEVKDLLSTKHRCRCLTVVALKLENDDVLWISVWDLCVSAV